MKRILQLILVIVSFSCQAQKNNIHPNRVYCDSDYTVSGIMQMDDGSFLAVGYLSNNVVADGLIMKLDANYNVVWRKTYGGSGNDRFNFINKINSNRFLVAGLATSIDGDLLSYSWPFITASNIWLMIIDSNGNFIRGNTYGYGSSTSLTGIQIRNDGNIFISGYTVAESGDFIGNPGLPLTDQVFVAFTDTLLTKKWLKYIVGIPSDGNIASHTALDKNNNLILPVSSSSTSGDYSGFGPLPGQRSAFLFCIDTNQSILWKKRFGGSGIDYFTDITCDSNNNLILVANTNSVNGDFYTNEVKWFSGGGNPSYATLLMTDSVGNIMWKHAFGSFDSTMIELRNVETAGMVIAGDKIWVTNRIQGRDSIGEGFGWTTQIGAVDNWVIQFDSIGNIENKIRIGGKQNDNALWIINNKQKNRALIGMLSIGGQITNFECRIQKSFDAKIFELEQWPSEISNIYKPLNLIWTISPNPNDGKFIVSFEKEFNGILKIYNEGVQNVFQKQLTETLKQDINLQNLCNGIYYFEISNDYGKQIKQLIINH
jgi:hypothetical protein